MEVCVIPLRVEEKWILLSPALRNSIRILPIDFQSAGFHTVITVDQYAASIVEKYRIIPDTSSTSHHASDKVVPLLK